MNPGTSAGVLVVGAGVVGVCCAAYLRRAGARVTLIDRDPPGEGCSFGNAGSISPAACLPIPAPGMLRKVPGWLLDDDGPLTIRWRHLPRLAPWLVRYLRAGNPTRVEHASRALRALHETALDAYADLTAAAGADELVRSTDYLFVYGSEASYEAARGGWALRRARGVEFHEVSAGELREREPDLSTHYARGVVIPAQGFAIDPSRLVKALAGQSARDGVTILRDEVRGFDVDGARVRAARTSHGALPIDGVVIAAGAYSRALTGTLGMRIPLEAERGYHATFADAGIRPRGTVMENDAKMVATPMEMGVRFAGMVELASVDTPMNARRADAIVRLAKRMYPALRTTPITQWMGRRPSLPDGLPVIDRSPRHDNVWLAFGHGHTGMSGAPATGRIVAGLVTGRHPNVDLGPYRADRF